MHVNNTRIENPYLFFILIPLVGLVLLGFFVIPKYKRYRIKNIISLILHLVRSVRLTLAFVDIQYVKSSSTTELIVLADCSKSEFNNGHQIDKLINDVYAQAGKVDGTKIGVVAFAKDQEVVTNIGSKYKSKDILKYFEDDSSFDNSATDLKSALLYADSLYSKDSAVRRRIIRSDGLETDGSAIEALDQLTADSVQIDAISRSQPEFDEVAITGLDYTDRCYIGKDQKVKVSVKSKKGGLLTLTLVCDGKQVAQRKNEPCNKGINVYTFDISADKAGTFRYEVSISGRSDTFEENNKRSFTQEISDHYNVLYISDDSSALENLQTSFPANAKFSSCGTASVPYNITDLIKYDEIILNNVNREDLDEPEQFVANLETAVKDYGKSLLTLGSVFAGAAKGDYLSDYNARLPIQSESDEGKAIVLVIDNSGSRESDNRLKKAKEGAKAILSKLNERDYISIVTFSDNTKIVSPLTSVKNKESVLKSITKIKSEGGTVRAGGLKAAHQQLKNSPTENKFVITLSDGDPFDSTSTLKKLVQGRYADNIICSFINISNSSGTSLLKTLAKAGEGTYYYCKTAASLVDVMVTSVVTDVNEKTIQEASEVRIVDTKDDSVKGIENLPSIDGYNFVRTKKSANTILTLTYKHENEKEDGGDSSTAVATVPLYAYWDIGDAKGRVASFTSDFGTAWTDSFRQSENGQLFRKQRIAQTLPTRNINSILDRKYENHGVTSSISFIAAEKNKNAKIHIKVTSPDGKIVKEYDLRYDGSTFSAEVETGEVGLYQVEVTYSYDMTKEDGSVETKTNDPEVRQLNFDYSSEYDRFPESTSTLLYSLTKNTGKVTYDSVDYQISSSEFAFKSYKSLNVVFRIIAVVLLLIDIFVRKSDFKKKKKDKDRNLRAGSK